MTQGPGRGVYIEYSNRLTGRARRVPEEEGRRSTWSRPNLYEAENSQSRSALPSTDSYCACPAELLSQRS